MIEISLTSFVDFVLKSGTPKMTVVKNTKKQIKTGYQPFTDYYKQIREGIIKFHKEDKQIGFLDSLANNITDKSKSVNFPIIVANYKKFAKKNKTAKWFNPAKNYWIIEDLSVSLNPELGLEINGKKHIIKLYFKADKPKKSEIPSVLQLMYSQLDEKQNIIPAFYDIRNNKLHSYKKDYEDYMPLIEGEGLSFQRIFNSI